MTKYLSKLLLEVCSIRINLPCKKFCSELAVLQVSQLFLLPFLRSYAVAVGNESCNADNIFPKDQNGKVSFALLSIVNDIGSALAARKAGNCGNSNQFNPKSFCSRDEHAKGNCIGV